MSSTSRMLVAQIALGAAFGTALAWKTARVRRVGPVSAGFGGDSEVPAPFDAPHLPAPSAGKAYAAATPSSASPSRILEAFQRLPDRAVMAIIIATLVPAIVGVFYVVTRSDGARAQGAQPAVSVPVTRAAQPVSTPTLADELLDARRVLDLGSVRDAANAYATLFGAYPSTGGVLTTLCVHSDDAGCEISKYANGLPVSDGQMAYWYAADGRSLTLLARVQTQPAQDDCPADLPAGLGNAPVFCLRATIGTP